jgi:hypothetical protein
VSPVRYKLGLYNPEDGILHRDHRDNLESYKTDMTFMMKVRKG